MVQFLSIHFFLGFLQFLLGFSKVPVFLCHSVYISLTTPAYLKMTVSSSGAIMLKQTFEHQDYSTEYADVCALDRCILGLCM